VNGKVSHLAQIKAHRVKRLIFAGLQVNIDIIRCLFGYLGSFLFLDCDRFPKRLGLILVEGAVPGAKGGWITVRDAVKKAPPKDLPKPGKFKAPAAAETPAKTEAAPAAEAPKEGA